VFRRRRRAEEESADLVEEGTADLDDTAGAPGDGPGGSSHPDGPWDADDAPDDEAEVTRVDLGGLRIPVRPDVELRVDMSPDGEVVAVTLVSGASAMQVNAFAAPRSAGIWAEVREEIAESLRAGGGSAEEAEGPFGTELRARVPGEVAGQGRVLQPARFLGVDGPRWFLRGLLSGPAATDPVQAAPLEELFRAVVVARGKDAMAPRDQLPLHLPRDVAQGPGEAGGQGPDINRLERGPEIAETR